MTGKLCNTNTICSPRKRAKWFYGLDNGIPVFIEIIEDEKPPKNYSFCCDECREEILRRFYETTKKNEEMTQRCRTSFGEGVLLGWHDAEEERRFLVSYKVDKKNEEQIIRLAETKNNWRGGPTFCQWHNREEIEWIGDYK